MVAPLRVSMTKAPASDPAVTVSLMPPARAKVVSMPPPLLPLNTTWPSVWPFAGSAEARRSVSVIGAVIAEGAPSSTPPFGLTSAVPPICSGASAPLPSERE